MKKCKDCGEELKYIAGGISKKGNRYEAFWGCKDKDCKYSEEPTPEEVKKYDLEARMNKMEEEQIRFKSIAWMNATNNAVEMSKRGKGLFRREWTREEIEENKYHIYGKSMEFFIKHIVNEED